MAVAPGADRRIRRRARAAAPARVLIAAAAALALAAAAPPGAAQEPDPTPAEATEGEPAAEGPASGGPVSPDSADRIRAAMELPPSRPPADVFDALSFPLRVALLPLAAVGKGIQGGVTLAFRGGPPNPLMLAFQDLRAWGLSPDVATFGPRGGLGGEIRLERFEPLFLESGMSIRGSQRHAVGLRAGDPAGLGGVVAGSFHRLAEPHFWGIGPATEPEAAADFRLDRVEVAGAGSAPTGPLVWRAALAYEVNEVDRGSDDEVPDLADVATPGLFGLEERTRFLRLGAGVAWDGTRIHVLQRRGARAELAGTLFLGTGDTDADFLRWNADLAGYLPLNERQQLAVRGVAELNRPQGGRGVPFTHLAGLGGSRLLRGFDTWRFRDFDMVALQSEWRYEIWRSIHDDLRQEGFLFFDAGTVAERIHRLEGSDVRTSWGFGMRTATGDGLAFLWYLAFGERTKFQVKFSWPF